MEISELSRFPLFRGLSAEETARLLSSFRGEERAFQKGETILRAGDPTERMGLVLEGSVTIESGDPWGNRTILSIVGAGQLFAEAYALLPREPLLVDVTANESCRILFLRIGSADELTQTEAPWVRKFMGSLLTISARKNLALSGRSFHTAPKTIRGRVMSYLNAVSLQRRSRAFSIPFDRQQLADYLNLDRSALSKELGRMQREGLITVRKNRFTLSSPGHSSGRE